MTLPLHDGSSQAARQRPELDPAFAALDERNLADVLAFTRAYAAGLVYVDADGADQGDWQALLPPADALPALAAALTAPPDQVAPQAAAWAARPQVALLLAFADLLGLTRAQLNGFTARHLDHFYRSVLRMVARPAVPDRLHVLARLEDRRPKLLLPAGTVLQAGKDAAGQPRQFSTLADLQASQVQVAALCSVRTHIRRTGIPQASRQYLVGGTRQQAFLAMLRIALGDPLPGDLVPLPLAPGLPPPAADGQPPAELEFDTLVQAHDIVGFVGTGLFFPLHDDFRQLMRLRARRLADDSADWAAINAVLALVAQRHGQGFALPPSRPDDFHANLRQALGLDVGGYAALYKRLPEVTSIEDVQALLAEQPKVQAFVADTLRLAQDEFRRLMQTKLRLDGQWREIAQLLEDAGRRRNPGLQLSAEQRALRNVDSLLAITHAGLAWPSPAAASLQQLHAVVTGIEWATGLSAEAFQFVMAVARRSLALPSTLQADSPADDADWDRVHALLGDAAQRVQVRRRQQALLRATRLPTLPTPAAVLGAMLAQALGLALSMDAAWPRLAALGLADADIAWLQTLAATPANAPQPPADATWQRAAELLELVQRQRQGGDGVWVPEQRIWHHVYPNADARSVVPGGPVAEGAAPRWQPFGNLARAVRRDWPAPPVVGWALSAPLLALAEGQRRISLVLGFDGDPARFDARALRQLLAPSDAAPLQAGANPFQVQLSGAEGWFTPGDVRLGWLRPAMDGYPGVPGLDTTSLRAITLQLVLGEQQPAVVPPTLALHGLQADAPALRLMLRTQWSDAFDCHHSAYQALAGLRLQRLALQVQVQGLATLALQNDQAVLDPKKPFEPFGLQPASGARLSIGHAELLGKTLDSIGFRGSWMAGPAALKSHYANYPGGLTGPSFTLRLGLRDGQIVNNLPAPLPLFGQADSPGALQLSASGLAEPGRLMPQPPSDGGPADWRRAWVWELAGDLQHAVYPPLALKLSLQVANAMATTPRPALDGFALNPPYTPKLKSLVADYSASLEQAAVPDLTNPAVAAQALRQPLGTLHHVLPFGHVALVPEAGVETGSAVPLLPELAAQGTLYIGLAGAQAPQRLSLLVQVAEGSADPEAPPEPLAWAVLDGNRWRSLQQGQYAGSLLADGTRALVNTGIVELQLPAVAPAGTPMALAPPLDGKPLPPAGLVWLRLQRQQLVDGVCDVVALHPNAVLAERVDAQRSADNLARALPPAQVTGTLAPVPGLAAITQPYSSFGGRPAEQAAHFNTRVSERLRHRQRALTPWDYEHLVLERFPQLYKVKCLRADARWQPQPGAVDLVVVPDITQRQPFDPFAPRASAELLADIQAWLADKLPASATLRVRNAHFVAVKVRCGVRFLPGTDEGWCRQQLNDDLNRHLSPWAYADGADLVIGGSLYANSIINFIEQRPYVDFIAGLRLFTGEQGRFTLVPNTPEHRIVPDWPDMVLVAAGSHEFDVIAANDQRVQGFEGIGNMRIELDFSIA